MLCLLKAKEYCIVFYGDEKLNYGLSKPEKIQTLADFPPHPHRIAISFWFGVTFFFVSRSLGTQ